MNNYIKFIVFILLLPLFVLYEILTTVFDFLGVKSRSRNKSDELDLDSDNIYKQFGLSRKAKELVQIIAIGPIAIPFLFIVGLLEWLTELLTFVSKVFPRKRNEAPQNDNHCKTKVEPLHDELDDFEPMLDDELDDLLNSLDDDLADLGELLNESKSNNQPKLPEPFEWVYKVTGKDHILIQDVIKDKASSVYCAKEWDLALEAIMRLERIEESGGLSIPSSKIERDKLRHKYEQEITHERIQTELEIRAWDKEQKAKSRHWVNKFFE